MTLSLQLAALLTFATASAMAGAQATSTPAPGPTPESIRRQAAPREAAPLVHPITTLTKKPATSSGTPEAKGQALPGKSAATPLPTGAPKPVSNSTAAPKSSSKPVVSETRPTVSPAQPTPQVPAGPSYGPLNRTTIVLDASHGGQDSGSRLSDSLLEKDVTLALAFKLRSLLQARGFNVVLTRDTDALTSDTNPTPLTLDDRAGIANHERAVACLLLHATSAGAGIHLYYSELPPAPGEATSLPWLTAQAAWVSQSTALSQKLSQAITRAGLPQVSSAASVRPVDSLTCPALVVELSPKSVGDTGTLSDSSYQSSAAEALTGALIFWRNQMQPPQRLVDAPSETAVHP